MKKYIFLAILICLCAILLVACSGMGIDDDHVHVYNKNIRVTVAATCSEVGEQIASCKCGATQTIETSPTNHTYVNGVCSGCRCTEGLEYGYAGSVKSVGAATATEIVIPAYYHGTRITEIEAGAFENCTRITSVTLPATITVIDYTAFQNCTELRSISIPSSVTSIGFSAFAGCTKLIQHENGVSYVDHWAIKGDSGMTKVTLRSGTVGIAEDAFIGASSLESVTLPEGLRVIDDSAFRLCRALRSINIPSSLIKIGVSAFDECTGGVLKTEGDVSYVGKWAVDCSTLANNVTLRADTVGIGEYAFFECQSLRSVYIPEDVVYIGRGAFSSCSALANVNFAKTDGWRYANDIVGTEGTDIPENEISDAPTAAKHLTVTYMFKEWFRVKA